MGGVRKAEGRKKDREAAGNEGRAQPITFQKEKSQL
jgi:hypothetical protein